MSIGLNSGLTNNGSYTQLYKNGKNMLLFFLFLLLVDGVSGAETNETVSVMEGDSVTLHTDVTQIQNDDTILWLFGLKDSVVSQITRKTGLTSFFVTDDVRFRGRVQVDQKTGSLTIRNTRIRHSGAYKLRISRQQTTTKIFHVNVSGVAGETDDVKSKSVTEGTSVTLWNDVEVQRDDLMVWRFGDKGILLAKIDVETDDTFLNRADERFRDRLQLNPDGSLTLKDTKTLHTGLYELQIRGRESTQRFLLSVTDVPGLSAGVVAVIVVAALLVFAVLSAVVIYYKRKISKLHKQLVSVQATEGENVVLRADLTAIQKYDVSMIQWYYGDKNNCIAEIKAGDNPATSPGADGRFRGKLSLKENGDLTITDIRTLYSGLYIMKFTSSTRTKYKRFIVSVTHEMTVPATEGENVDLLTDLTAIRKNDEIQWYYGDKNNCIAEIKAGGSLDTSPGPDGRFRGKLSLKKKTGDLTITDIRTLYSGLYIMKFTSGRRIKYRRFTVSVTPKEESVTEGESITLRPKLSNPKINKDDVILWTFGAEKSLVASNVRPPKTDRVSLDEKTGSLSIRNIIAEDAGHYKLQIINSQEAKGWRVNVTLKGSTENQSPTPATALLEKQGEEPTSA